MQGRTRAARVQVHELSGINHTATTNGEEGVGHVLLRERNRFFDPEYTLTQDCFSTRASRLTRCL